MFRFSVFLKDLAVIRTALMISAVLFAAGIAAGWAASGPMQQMLAKEIQGLGEVSQNLQQSDNPELSFFIFIFLNNSIKAVLVMFAGLLFGFIPFVFLIINGMVIGFLLNLMDSNGVNLSELIIKGLLPHGIIEIPVILIACAYGLALGGLVFKSLTRGGFKGSGTKTEWSQMWRRTRTASLWIVVLLLIAAVIESTITLWLMS